MGATLHGIKNCDTVRKARKWLDKQAVDYRYRDFREDPPTEAEILGWFEQCDWQQLLNKRSTTWKSLDAPARERITGAGPAALLMAQHPTVIKRPVLVAAQDISVGFDEACYKALLIDSKQ